jgi:hypothetical protein
LSFFDRGSFGEPLQASQNNLASFIHIHIEAQHNILISVCNCQQNQGSRWQQSARFVFFAIASQSLAPLVLAWLVLLACPQVIQDAFPGAPVPFDPPALAALAGLPAAGQHWHAN